MIGHLFYSEITFSYRDVRFDCVKRGYLDSILSQGSLSLREVLIMILTFFLGFTVGALVSFAPLTNSAVSGRFDEVSSGRLRKTRDIVLDLGSLPEVYNPGATKLLQIRQGGVNKQTTQHNSLIGSKSQIGTIHETENNETKSRNEQTFEEIKHIPGINVFRDLHSKEQADLSTENVGTVLSDQTSDTGALLGKQLKARDPGMAEQISPPEASINIKKLHHQRRPLLADTVEGNKDLPKVVNSRSNKIVTVPSHHETMAAQRYSTTDENKSGRRSKGDNSFAKLETNNNAATYNTTKRLSDKALINHIYWSDDLLKSCPGGFTDRDHRLWSEYINGARVVKLQDGCGRMQNRLVIFKDSTKACARYRMNTDQIQGEVYSYYLAKLLNITNIPPSVVNTVMSQSELWNTAHLDLTNSGWNDGKPVVLTKWVENLSPAYIPRQFKGEQEKLSPTMINSDKKSDLCELVQWSDLLILDYLSANLDRIVNNMFNKQWNPHMMDNPAHNLEQTSSGQLIFLDNESGLFHGYRLLEKYAHFHDDLLKSACVFKRSTADAIKQLHRSGKIGEQLSDIFKRNEPNYKSVPAIPPKNINILKERLATVYNHIEHCENDFR